MFVYGMRNLPTSEKSDNDVGLCTEFHHGGSSSQGLSNITKLYRCGDCRQQFSAICALHTHLKGKSYHFEEETMTAFPLTKSTCTLPGALSEEFETLEPDATEPSEKYYKVYKMRKRKQSQEDPSTVKIIKVIDSAVQPPDTDSCIDENVTNQEVENDGIEGSENTSIALQSTVEAAQYEAQEFITIQPDLCITSPVEELGQKHGPEAIGGGNQNTRDNFYSQNQNNSVSSNIYILETEGSKQFAVKNEALESVETSRVEDYVVLDDEHSVINDAGEVVVSTETQTQVTYHTLKPEEFDRHNPLSNQDGSTVTQVVKEYLVPEKLASDDLKQVSQGLDILSSDSDVHVKPYNTYINTAIIDENCDMQSTVFDSITAGNSGDVDLEEAVAAFDEVDATEEQNKQMEITLYGIKTNEDGSLRVVVGENDSGVFNTPMGDEILKALKAQVNDIPADGSVQIVLPVNYSNSNFDTNLVDTELSSKEVDLLGNEGARSRRPKRQRKLRIDDDSLPKFMINLPHSLDELESVSDSGEQAKQNKLKAIVFQTSQEKLSAPDALNILTECNLGMHQDKISKIQPISAKGGEVYVVDLMALPNKRDCRYDKYLWVNCVTRKFPFKDPIMNKHVFKIRLPNNQFSDAFQRHMFEFIEEARYCIVHYIGHESIFQPLSHGNSKSGAIFNRTCPSVLQELKELSKKEGVTADRVYKQIESLNIPETVKGLRAPRNLAQIKNHFRQGKMAREKQHNTFIKETMSDRLVINPLPACPGE